MTEVMRVQMAQIQERMVQMRADADAALERAVAAESRVKQLEQTLLEKENDTKSLRVKLDTSEDALDRTHIALRVATESVRALDVKAAQAAGQVAVAQHKRDRWEAKCEEIDAKYRGVKAGLDELDGQMEVL
ncbi:hypothetical protein B0H16DRAFT_1895514 [Mycena metata]|uniref:Tropomyosin n=1 Tax=Mycena metata TaxID=1033252 RepID=A0AAD7HMX7_9AGAR|nr:hypothetical protein B0H16DRAFT_1895514 [Mycena metata]